MLRIVDRRPIRFRRNFNEFRRVEMLADGSLEFAFFSRNGHEDEDE